MSKAIGDQAAIKYSLGFYDGIVSGRGYEDAFDLGRNAIDLRGIPEHETPVLLKKPAPVAVPFQRQGGVQKDNLDELYAAAASEAKRHEVGINGRGGSRRHSVTGLAKRQQPRRILGNLSDRWVSSDHNPENVNLRTLIFTFTAIGTITSASRRRPILCAQLRGQELVGAPYQGMSEIVLRGYMVHCPVCGTVVRSTVDGGYVSLKCLRCGQHALVPLDDGFPMLIEVSPRRWTQDDNGKHAHRD